jgi:4-hydroxybutyrate CoA-transferase
VICRNENIVTMNGALMVDLTGQIGVYSIGPAIYTGLGGHLGFALGAALAPRGRAVTILPSTARGGSISTIVPQFDAGQLVSVPRELADTIVTEHGIARLLGRSVRERAEELIRVADPSFREELRFSARKLFYD